MISRLSFSGRWPTGPPSRRRAVPLESSSGPSPTPPCNEEVEVSPQSSRPPDFSTRPVLGTYWPDFTWAVLPESGILSHTVFFLCVSIPKTTGPPQVLSENPSIPTAPGPKVPAPWFRVLDLGSLWAWLSNPTHFWCPFKSSWNLHLPSSRSSNSQAPLPNLAPQILSFPSMPLS